MTAQILRLNTAGKAIEWLSWQEAVCLYARDLISWSYGEEVFRIRGGFSRATGERTVVTLNSIIACKGKVWDSIQKNPPLTNRALFQRDQYICLYCGKRHNHSDLSRDHLIPISRGGRDIWTNVVTACKRCNAHKGSRLLDECSLDLLALPYRPSHAEYLALTNSGRILGDQMEFLRKQFSSKSRLLTDDFSRLAG